MKTFTNGYGETIKQWEIGDRAIFTSSKYPELVPYEVIIDGIYAEMDHGHPAYLRYQDSGWQMYSQFSEVKPD